jgi:hypothetical protein
MTRDLKHGERRESMSTGVVYLRNPKDKLTGYR